MVGWALVAMMGMMSQVEGSDDGLPVLYRKGVIPEALLTEKDGLALGGDIRLAT